MYFLKMFIRINFHYFSPWFVVAKIKVEQNVGEKKKKQITIFSFRNYFTRFIFHQHNDDRSGVK